MNKVAIALISVLLLTSHAQASVQIPNIGQSDISLPQVHSGETPHFSRVVALANGTAEIVAALGYKKILVGRDIASTIPELAKVPIDTDAHQVSVERVLSQKPDLILIDSNTSPTSALSILKNSGIRLVKIPDAWTLASVSQKEAAVAHLLGVPKAQKLLAAQITQTKFNKKKLKIAFLYVRGTASIYLIGGKGSGADSLISAMGFSDIGALSLPHPFNALTAEALIKMQPDVLLLMTKGLESVGGINGLRSLPGVGQTAAGKAQRIVTVDDSLLLSFGPRSIPLLGKLRAAILKVSTQ